MVNLRDKGQPPKKVQKTHSQSGLCSEVRLYIYTDFLLYCRLTVKKKSLNNGRKFYKCQKCDFFQWKNEEEITKQKSGNTSNLRKRERENSYTSVAIAPKLLKLAG